MKTYITYFDDNQIKEYNLQASDDVILFKGNDISISGDNINHLNIFYCELTTLYWVWKNTNDEVLCFKQYRRPFNPHTTPKEGEVVTYNPISMYYSVINQFKICHGYKRGNDVMKVLKDIYGDDSKYYRYWTFMKQMYTNNTFVINREDFNNMCEFVFGVLFKLDKYWKLNMDYNKYMENAAMFAEDGRPDYQKHFMAYIGERLVSTYIMCHLKSICEERPMNNGFYLPYKQNNWK